MKKNIFLYIIAIVLVFVSCSKDDSTSPTVKYITINLQIGGDSTLNLSGGSTPFTYSNSDKEFVKKEENIVTTRSSNIINFVPEVPTKFTAYFIANETKNGYSINQFVDSIPVYTGSNYITVPAMKYKVYVSNYKDPGREINGYGGDWYDGYYTDPMQWPFPESSTTLYLYGDSALDFTNSVSGEVKLINPFAAIAIYNNQYVIGYPFYFSHSETTSVLTTDKQWYYLYVNCYRTNSAPIYIFSFSNILTFNDIVIYPSANKIYQIIIDNSK